MNINQICMKCMTGKINEEGKCTSCGALQDAEKNGSKHLPVKTILKGKYLVGRVIGEGGFGITYIGYDLDLEIRVAIKEFCPKNSVERDIEDGLTIYPYSESAAEEFEREKEKFINEARRLAKFRNEGGVVSVLDYFIENGTAYIVMDYIDGITLKNYLKTLRDTTGRNMNMAGVLNLFKPVMETLAKIHKSGIIHRDISPENIMISKDFTKVYLIDFGTARDMENGHTLSEYYKGFYSPIEQRSSQSKGKMEQGPWTDVYALCATIYVCITGRVMSDSVSRIVEDDLISPSKFGIDISPSMEAVLMQGLAVKPQDRIQSVEELMQAFYGEKSSVASETQKENENTNIDIQETDVEDGKLPGESVWYSRCMIDMAKTDNIYKIVRAVNIIGTLCFAILYVWRVSISGFFALDSIGIFVIWLGLFVIGITVQSVLEIKIKRTLFPDELSISYAKVQIEYLKRMLVCDGRYNHFIPSNRIKRKDYEQMYFKYRDKSKHPFHTFLHPKHYGIHPLKFNRFDLILYYYDSVQSSKIPEEVKKEWVKAAINSWIAVEKL